MSKTATLGQDGRYNLTPPIKPVDDALTFASVALIAVPAIGTYVLGIGADGGEHPAPLHRAAEVMAPRDALAALGYTLA